RGVIDALRGGLETIERRHARMTYVAAAGLLIALATAGVALYLGITNNQDMETKDDVNALKDEVAKVRTESQADTQTQIKALTDQITALQKQVAAAQATAQRAKAAAAQAPAANTLPSLTPTLPTPTTPSNGGSGNNKNP